MLRLEVLMYIEGTIETMAHFELSHRNPDILERVLNQIALSNSTAWKVICKL